MDKFYSKQGRPSPLAEVTARRTRLPHPRLTPGLRTGYALISFILGATYLKVIFGSSLPGFLSIAVAAIIGIMCFAVCFLNLISLWRKNS
ncbi:MAG: hypothetical protein ABFS17_00875 [Chloroflexota bacterium]